MSCRQRIKLTGCIAAVAMAMVVGQTNADDRYPPLWRGTPGATFQHWHFPTGSQGAPNDTDNPYGMPALTVHGGAVWLDHFPAPPEDGADGVWWISDGGGGAL